MNDEIWKEIPNIKGYEVSDLGRVKSKKTGKICSQQITPSGYYHIALFLGNKKQKTYRVHRLVASAFIPNPNNYNIINHINGNKLDNRPCNLEWCSQKHNANHAYKMGLRNNNYLKKKIAQYDLEGNLIKIWNSQEEIEKTLGFAQSGISCCCRGINKTARNYKWKYYEGNGRSDE